MSLELKELGRIVQPKPTEPDTTPSLRDALTRPLETVESYYVTAALRAIVREVLDTAVHRKGQGYWIRAEYGAGKTHFIATLTLLLTNRDQTVWRALHSDEIRRDYAGPLQKTKLYPVTFSLMGTGEADASDSLMRRFEKEISTGLPKELQGKVSVLSEELAVEWFENQAGSRIKELIAGHIKSEHRTSPAELRAKEGARRLGAEILEAVRAERIDIDLKGSFRERFAHIYDRITKAGGYDGMLFVIDEFRSWQDRHEGKPSFEEGVQILETLAYYLPVEENLNIVTIVASQGDCPQKLVGSGRGDRFIVRELLSGKEQTDYGEIVSFRVRDIQQDRDIEIDEYFTHCRDKFRFLRQTPKEYFRAIFPFQPRCFDILRRVTQSYERYGLPAARSGIHIAYETLRNDGLMTSRRLAVLSDLLASKTLTAGLRSEQFRSSFESYQYAIETLDMLPMDEEERDAARRIIGTLYLWSVVSGDSGRGLTLNELAEATLASLEGVKPEDAVLDLVTRLKSDVPQIKYDRERGARFEITETDGKKPERVFGTFKKKAKTDPEAQNKAWRDSLFWDFKALEGAGSEEGFEGGFFDGYCDRDARGEVVLPRTTPVKATPSALRVQYGGEVLVADRWQSTWGEYWTNHPEVHFRIVYLTRRADVNRDDLRDARIAVCMPAEPSEDTRENLAEYVACNLMLAHYNDKDYPGEATMRDWAKTRRRAAISAVLKNQIEEFRRGTVITQKELGLPASQFFMTPSKVRGKREEALAAQLLEKAYDRPLFTPKDFKKDFTDNDARKVFHGLFAKAQSTADVSARDNFAPGLGLVAKNNLSQFAPQAGSAVLYIQEKVKPAGDVALMDLVKELCQPPYGLTEEIIRLAVLCAVRAGTPPLVIADLNPSANFVLTTGREPSGKRITSRVVGQIEWSAKLERALLGARVKISDEKPFNEVLPYAQIIDPDLSAAHTPDEEVARNNELCRRLESLLGEVDAAHGDLSKLAAALGGKVDDATTEVLARLRVIAASEDYQGFHAVAKENYATPELFRSAYQLLERARRFNARRSQLQLDKSYLTAAAQLGDNELAFERDGLSQELQFDALWKDESKLPALLERFQLWKERYSLAYRKAHRTQHEAMEKLEHALGGLNDQLTIIDRLNQLGLGTPLEPRLSQDITAMRSKVHPCALKDNAQVEDNPRCGACNWDGQTAPPQETVEQLIQRANDAAGELCKRVAQETIRKILEASGKPDIKTLLDMITASKVRDLARLLTPEMIQQIRALLAAANIEHRDLAVTNLLEGLTSLEEAHIDDFLQKLRKRLFKAFDEAKKETRGKKRIRFFLK